MESDYQAEHEKWSSGTNWEPKRQIVGEINQSQGDKMDRRGKIILIGLALAILILAARGPVSYWRNYEKPEIIKADIKDYLYRKYKVEFEVGELEYYMKSWRANADPVTGPGNDTYVVWEKNASPHVTFDTYPSDRLSPEALKKAEQYFKKLYGENTLLFFGFSIMDDQFLASEEAKTIGYEEEIAQYRQSNSIEVQCYIFKKNKQSKAVKEQDAERAIREYFNQTAFDWRFDVFYLSDNYEEQFKKDYAKDANFFRLKGLGDPGVYKRMHKDGQLLDWISLFQTKDQPVGDVNSGFYFENNNPNNKN